MLVESADVFVWTSCMPSPFTSASADTAACPSSELSDPCDISELGAEARAGDGLGRMRCWLGIGTGAPELGRTFRLY